MGDYIDDVYLRGEYYVHGQALSHDKAYVLERARFIVPITTPIGCHQELINFICAAKKTGHPDDTLYDELMGPMNDSDLYANIFASAIHEARCDLYLMEALKSGYLKSNEEKILICVAVAKAKNNHPVHRHKLRIKTDWKIEEFKDPKTGEVKTKYNTEPRNTVTDQATLSVIVKFVCGTAENETVSRLATIKQRVESKWQNSIDARRMDGISLTKYYEEIAEEMGILEDQQIAAQIVKDKRNLRAKKIKESTEAAIKAYEETRKKQDEKIRKPKQAKTDM